jgi:hypothetical protein
MNMFCRNLMTTRVSKPDGFCTKTGEFLNPLFAGGNWGVVIFITIG